MTLRYREYIGPSKKLVEEFISSLYTSDQELAPYIVDIVSAHLVALVKSKLIPPLKAREIAKILLELQSSRGRAVYEWISRENLAFEDYFEALEAYLSRRIGRDSGFLALGRSRNDQIAAALRLAVRDKLLNLLDAVLELRKLLINTARRFRGVLFPYFTHQQLAQVGSAAHYFLSYEEALSDLTSMLLACMDIASKLPLGSGPAVGTLAEVDIKAFRRLLCLDDMLPPYYATGSRVFAECVVAGVALLLIELSRFAEDILMLNTLIPNFVKMPSEHIATSSIMPHKRNLVTLELVRAKAGKVVGNLLALLGIAKGLPYGYNLDLQEANTVILESLTEAEKVLGIIADFVKGIDLDEKVLHEYLVDKVYWSAELAEEIAIKTNRPLREVYFELARALAKDKWAPGIHVKQLLSESNIEFKSIRDLIRQRPVEKIIDKYLDRALTRLMHDTSVVAKEKERIQSCKNTLIRELSSLAGEGF